MNKNKDLAKISDLEFYIDSETNIECTLHYDYIDY